MSALTFTNDDQSRFKVVAVTTTDDAGTLVIERSAPPVKLTITWEGSESIPDTKMRAAVKIFGIETPASQESDSSVSGYINVTKESTTPFVLAVSSSENAPSINAELKVQMLDKKDDSQWLGFSIPVKIT